MEQQGLIQEIELPNGVSFEILEDIVKVSGPKGEVKKLLRFPGIKVQSKDNKITISSDKSRQKEKKIIGTFKAHTLNLIRGVQEGHTYKLKICSGHFPMNVSIANNEIVIKNFLGEKTPRITKVLEGSSVKLEGEFITVESPSKETAGQMGANIERLTKIKGKDLRVFQDGIYLINKDGKEIK